MAEHRKAAQREPKGITKTEILLYVASKDKVDAGDIRLFLKKNLNIINRMGITRHINELVMQNFLHKVSSRKGLSDLYYLDRAFTTFCKLSTFFEKTGKELKFMDTLYFKTVVESDQFRIDLFKHTLKEIARSVHAYINTPEGYSDVLESAGKKPEYRRDTLTGYYDKLRKWTKEEFDSKFDFYFGAVNDIFTSDQIGRFIDILLPKPEQEEIKTMIKSSPSSLGFILHMNRVNNLQFMGITMKFFISAIVEDPKKQSKLAELHEAQKTNKPKLTEMYNSLSDFSNIVGNSPFYILLESAFISDYMNNKILWDSENKTEKLLLKILLPKAK